MLRTFTVITFGCFKGFNDYLFVLEFEKFWVFNVPGMKWKCIPVGGQLGREQVSTLVWGDLDNPCLFQPGAITGDKELIMKVLECHGAL